MSYKENYPSQLLAEAVDDISSLPGIGRRSALRLALHLLKQPQENVHHFTSAINHLRDDVRYCRNCMMISDGDVCSICSDRSRDSRTICVVESVRDVMSIENTGQYHGVYHVLGGIISPIDGVGPSDLNIPQLVSRLEELTGGDGDLPAPVEVILALSGDVEGAKKYLDLFCKKSDIARRYVLKWMAIVAAAMSVNCNEEDKEKLITMINKSDFE